MIAASCRGFDRWHPGGLVRASELLSAHGMTVALHPKVDASFPDGETYVDLPSFRQGTPVFLHQVLADNSKNGPDAALLALMVAARAYWQYGAGPITAVVPFLAYARQDRVIHGQRRPTTSGLIADLLSAAGISRVVAVQSGSTMNLDRQFATPTLWQAGLIRYLADCACHYDTDSTILVAPDTGALGDVRAVAELTGHAVYAAEKTRLSPEMVRLRAGTVIARPERFRHALVLDDLVSSAGTVCAAFETMRRNGIKTFSIAVAHCRLTQTGQERLSALVQTGELVRLHTTDTVPTDWCSPALQVTPFMSAFGPELMAMLNLSLGATK